jgi:hypothetical protein
MVAITKSQNYISGDTISQVAVHPQSLSNYMKRRQHLQEKNTSEVREEPATVDFVRANQ